MKFKIVVIGAGKIAYSLSSSLINANQSVISVISRNAKSAEALAKKFGIEHFTYDLKNIPGKANLFLLTVPDNEISKTANQLSKLKLNFKDSVFIHFSGAENISILHSLKSKGGRTASIHLMQTFPSKKIVKLSGVYSAIETDDDELFQLLKKFCENLGFVPFRIRSQLKPYYHLAGVFASNFMAGTMFIAKKFLEMNDIPPEYFFDLLTATVYSTLDNIKKIGPSKALSGPVDRGDLQTIKKHIEAIRKLKPAGKFDSILILRNYLAQSLNLIDVVQEKQTKLKESQIAIRKYLVQELKKIQKSI